MQSEVPVVILSAIPDDLPYDYIHTDDRRVGYIAMRHLLDLGRRHIAIVTTHPQAHEEPFASPEPMYERVLGAYQVLMEVGLAHESCPVFFTSNTSESGRAVGQKLLSAGSSRPDAIFCTSDTIAFGLLEVFRLGGMHVPGDIAVVSHDGLAASALSVPALTTIAPRAREMGTVCVDRLLHLTDTSKEPVTDIVEADLVVRASTIGTGLVPPQGISIPISAEHVWSQWRTQSIPAVYREIPVTCVPLDQIIVREGEL
ncbi:MAG TPA: substrate-binding domain-containing protein [Ktedonobacteraceae bacterium]